MKVNIRFQYLGVGTWLELCSVWSQLKHNKKNLNITHKSEVKLGEKPLSVEQHWL